ncbi:MAG: hypothetical protein HYR60_13985 [Acidobacteria bacterium]|nr:hypothetical protein [Acidobacteriota bacterium]MBI3472487.1 hypothetical protein [Candidatus Solibacter usitatus]
MELPHDFFTPQSALTLSGATTMTYVVASGCQAAFNFNPRWLALAIAIAITAFGTWNAHGGPVDYVFAIVNGFLVFLSAVGISATVPEKKSRSFGETKRGFFARWY